MKNTFILSTVENINCVFSVDDIYQVPLMSSSGTNYINASFVDVSMNEYANCM